MVKRDKQRVSKLITKQGQALNSLAHTDSLGSLVSFLFWLAITIFVLSIFIGVLIFPVKTPWIYILISFGNNKLVVHTVPY